MKSYVIVAALAAIAFSNAAYAGGPQQMRDAEMDSVTAGGLGVLTAIAAGGNAKLISKGNENAFNHGGFGQKGNIPGQFPKFGNRTAGKPGA
jgi:hypothetical protein